MVGYLMLDEYGQYGKFWVTPYYGADGIVYNVHMSHGEREKALGALIRIQQRNITLLDYLRKNYPGDIRTERMLTYYNPDNIIENSPFNHSGDTAYVMNRGQEFRMCIRDKNKDNPRVYDDNTLSFVQIHEMAHLASSTYDHDVEFWQNFKWLLGRGVDAGIYRPVDYSIAPFTYCGLYVDYNPYYDSAY
jgi:hypothetical protein